VVLGCAAAAIAALSARAVADSFTPVRVSIAVSSVARLHVALPLTVTVSADPGALDDRTAPLRVRVKLAQECGGTYQYTPGTILLDKRLSPQPVTGHAYSGSVLGSGRPGRYGVQTVCLWLEEEGDNRVFYSDQSVQVNVSKACTRTASRYDAARARRRRPGRRRGRGSKRVLAADRRAARRACGPGVPL